MGSLDHEKRNRLDKEKFGLSSPLRKEKRAQSLRDRHSLAQQGFIAKYSGTCTLCKEPILIGTTIRMWSRPKVAHIECVNNQ